MSVVSTNPFSALLGPYLISFSLLFPDFRADEQDQAPETAPPPTTAAAEKPPAKSNQRSNRGRGKYPPRGGYRSSAPREGADDEGADDSAGKNGTNLI